MDINKKLTLKKNGKSYIVLHCKLWQSKWGRRGRLFPPLSPSDSYSLLSLPYSIK